MSLASALSLGSGARTIDRIDHRGCAGYDRPGVERTRLRKLRPCALPDEFDEEQARKAALERPPTLFWRVIAALFYMVPWIDSVSLGRFIYARFRNLIFIYMMAGRPCGASSFMHVENKEGFELGVKFSGGHYDYWPESIRFLTKDGWTQNGSSSTTRSVHSCACRALAQGVLFVPVRSSRHLLHHLPRGREEYEAAPLCEVQRHAGAWSWNACKQVQGVR